MHRFLAAVLLAAATCAHAALLFRAPEESAHRFAQRHAPGAVLVHRVLETTAWGTRHAIIAFQRRKSDEGERRIEGVLYLPRRPGEYRRIEIDTYRPEGGAPRIESVFFADAGRDKRRVLVVLVAWPQVHADVRGTLYGVHVYGAPGDDNDESRLPFERETSTRLESGCDCSYRDGRKTQARFRNAAQVREALLASP
jgi:hypothetical protein